MKIEKIQKDEFVKLYKNINGNENYDIDFLFNLLNELIDYFNVEIDNNLIDSFTNLNPFKIFIYLYEEYNFFARNLTKEEIIKLNSNQEQLDLISSISLDKYLTNEKLDFKDKSFTNRYNPNISSLMLYLNFMDKVNSEFSKNNPFYSLISDILMKCIKISKCILELLIDGFETEAFSTWRTLHETECILTILIKYQKPMLNSYLKHLKYSLAYRKLLGSPEQTDKVFEQIKSEMKSYDLKSKDMKKYIEYGYLYSIEGFRNDPLNKLNFRDGIEKMADLSAYSKLYEYSSEIAHSSPLMIYSNDYSLYHLTLISVYEVFFRIEKIFSNHLLIVNENEDFKNQYLNMRNVYYSFINQIYNIEKEIYNKLANHKTF